ncbi:MAG: hypothetical protein ABIL58_10420 [Pseudomonadota bacterium]
MLETVTNVLGAVAGGLFTGGLGAITGLFGSIVTGWVKLKTLKEVNRHDEVMVKAQSDASIAEIKANIRRDEVQTQGAIELKEADGFIQSSLLATQKQFITGDVLTSLTGNESAFLRWVGAFVTVVMAFADALSATMRPFMTYYLLCASTWVTYLAWKLATAANGGAAMTAAFAQNLLTQVILTILYLTVTAVTWWYCDRRQAKDLDKILGKIAT